MVHPRKHHFLPQWYLTRWARPAVIWQFSRHGPDNKLVKRYKHPAQTGYGMHLYTVPGEPPAEAARIERDFLQKIDDRGAKAIALAEANEHGAERDKYGLVQFVLSLLHRTPDRIDWIENRLREALEEHPEFDNAGDEIYRDGALWVMADLIQSDKVLARLLSLKTFFITIGASGYDLLTGDRPILLSDGLASANAFVLLPVGPRRLMVMAEKRDVADYLVAQEPKILSKAINATVVVQANNLIISTSGREFKFVEDRLGIPEVRAKYPFDEKTGLVRWSIDP